MKIVHQFLIKKKMNKTNLTFEIKDNIVQKTPIGTLIEFYIFCSVFEDYINLPLKNFVGHLRAIDPQSPLLDEADLFKTEECYEQTAQKYSDVFIYFIKHKKDLIEISKIYRDVKMDYKGPSTGHITVKPYLNKDLKAAKAYLNDYTSYWQKQMQKDKKIKLILQEAYNQVKTIQAGLIEENLASSMIEIKKILIELTLNPELIEAGLNTTVVHDFEYNEDFLLEEIQNNIQKDERILELFNADVLYPQSNNIYKINWMQLHKIILESNNRYGFHASQRQVVSNYKETFIEFCFNNSITNE